MTAILVLVTFIVQDNAVHWPFSQISNDTLRYLQQTATFMAQIKKDAQYQFFSAITGKC